MKLKIRESSERLEYVNADDGMNYSQIKIINVIKYITLYTDN